MCSEERRGDEFVKKVESAVELRSDVMIVGRNKPALPNLLIIDEIDGLPAGDGAVLIPFLIVQLSFFSRCH